VGKPTDLYPKGVTLYYLPVETRVPLKFGPETLTHVTCARVRMRVEGWGETPLSVQWVWPSSVSYEERHNALKEFTKRLAEAWTLFNTGGHPMEVGHAFQKRRLPKLRDRFNKERAGSEPMPWLAALVCCSPFDVALHDAYGMLHQRYIYDLYTPEFMSLDLAHYLTPADDVKISFAGKYPADYLVSPRPETLPAWHLVGGKDKLDAAELDGTEPNDGYPILLGDWIDRDGLKCLKAGAGR
jgi:uncharacterized protein YggL (DUF469 family)